MSAQLIKRSAGSGALAVGRGGVPGLFSLTPAAAKRTVEFFTAHIRNPNTRKAYARAVAVFAAWCEERGLQDLATIEPVHVAAYVEQLQERLAAPSVKLNLAALRMLFDWLVVGQVMRMNPASSVRGPRHSVRKGKTPCSRRRRRGRCSMRSTSLRWQGCAIARWSD